MSVLDRQGPPLPGSIDSSEDQQQSQPSLDGDKLTEKEDTSGGTLHVLHGLDPHTDARELVRLVQCQQCSLPLRQPVTLQCGNSICRQCLPKPYERKNISYPSQLGRQEGFTCPFVDCGQEHTLADCSQDVTLAKVLECVSTEVARIRPLTSNTPMLLDERLHWRNVVDSSILEDVPRSRVLHGGRLVATYTMAELGELRYDSHVTHQTMSPTGDSYQHLDLAMLDHLREATRNELDCHLCYSLLLDPVTTPCGHTYCRKCVSRVIDHSTLCPECRRNLNMTPMTLADKPANLRLLKLLLALCSEHVKARAEAAEAEEASLKQSDWVPLFVCTLAYPQIPIFLHVFEPRYRLMIRRAMERDRMFGMLAYNQRGETQGDLGQTQFLRYGTLLEIVNLQLLNDGRSLIETRGVSRFCVTDHDMRDGYVVGRLERIDDIPVAEEEALEAEEVSSANAAPLDSTSPTNSTPVLATDNPSSAPISPTGSRPLTSLSTAELLSVGISFVHRMHAASAPWLSYSATAGYGPMPDDPAIFPYWFASVLPIDDAEKYKLLTARTVRRRLQICAEWVRRVERMRWYSGGSCIVL